MHCNSYEVGCPKRARQLGQASGETKRLARDQSGIHDTQRRCEFFFVSFIFTITGKCVGIVLRADFWARQCQCSNSLASKLSTLEFTQQKTCVEQIFFSISISNSNKNIELFELERRSLHSFYSLNPGDSSAIRSTGPRDPPNQCRQKHAVVFTIYITDNLTQWTCVT